MSESEQHATQLQLHRILLIGAVLVKHGKHGKPCQKHVRCTESGVLTWTDRLPSDAPNDLTEPQIDHECAIRLTQVTTVVKGKLTRSFQRKSAAELPANMCFSIITDNRSIDLQATSEEQRDVWVDAITSAVLNAKRGITIGAADYENELKNALAKSDTDPPLTKTDMEYIGFLDTGGQLVKHSRRGAPKPKNVYVRMGKFFWGPPNKTTVTADHSTYVDLVAVLEVCAGKTTQVFKRKSAAKVDEDLCFSLVLGTRTVDFECPDRQLRDIWVNAMDFAVRKAKELVERKRLFHLQIRERYRRASLALDGNMRGKKELRKLTSDELQMLAWLSHGGFLWKHGRYGKPKNKWASASGGKLYWSEAQDGRSGPGPNPSSISLVDVIKVCSGLSKSAMKSQVPGSFGFSVMTEHRTLDFDAHSLELRDRWVAALQFAVDWELEQKEHAAADRSGKGDLVLAARLAGAELDTDELAKTEQEIRELWNQAELAAKKLIAERGPLSQPATAADLHKKEGKGMMDMMFIQCGAADLALRASRIDLDDGPHGTSWVMARARAEAKARSKKRKA